MISSPKLKKNYTSTAISGFAFDNKQFFTIVFIPYFLTCTQFLVYAVLYRFQCLMQCMAYLFVAVCRTALVHFHPKSGLVLFQFDSWLNFPECRAVQIQGIVMIRFLLLSIPYVTSFMFIIHIQSCQD